MMKRYIYIRCFLVMLIVFVSCKDGQIHNPISKSNNIPAPVSNVKITPLHGGAKISYDIPANENILLVKAVVQKKDGLEEVKKSSYYKKELILEGFADTTIYNVKLYTVNRAQKESKPINVKIKPLLPPILYIFSSLKIENSFGGAKITFANEYKGEVRISVLTKDSVGNSEEVSSYYTQEKQGSFYIHGYPPKKRRFGAYVRDQWGNYSDTIYKDVIPLFEQEIPKSGFKEVDLPTDTYKQNFCCDSHFSALWDGITHVNVNMFATPPGSPIPQWFTIDMGVKAKLDRFKVYSRYDPNGAGAYSQSDPKIIELWGSNNPNTTDGSWDSWVKLGRFVAKKPSGSPAGQYTQEDVDYATVNGQEYRILNAEDKPAVRYIRFKTVETWTAAHGNGVTIDELTFWGKW